MTFTLEDDGTLDTVLTCDECGAELRYASGAWDHDDECDDPDNCDCRIEIAVEDAEATHECG